MKHLSLLALPLAGALFALGEGLVEAAAPEAPATGTPAGNASSSDSAAIDAKIKAVDLADVRMALAKIDLSAARAKYEALTAALGKKDFVQAEAHAKPLDAMLGNARFSKSVEFLKLEAEQGTDAALAAVKEYANTPGLDEAGKRFSAGMIRYLQSVNRGQVAGIAYWVVYYSVRGKLSMSDGHLADITAAAAAIAVVKGIETGFLAFDLNTEEGLELSDAISEASGVDKDLAKAAWRGTAAALSNKKNWDRLGGFLSNKKTWTNLLQFTWEVLELHSENTRRAVEAGNKEREENERARTSSERKEP